MLCAQLALCHIDLLVDVVTDHLCDVTVRHSNVGGSILGKSDASSKAGLKFRLITISFFILLLFILQVLLVLVQCCF